jgi:hypothetical protein
MIDGIIVSDKRGEEIVQMECVFRNSSSDAIMFLSSRGYIEYYTSY